MFSVLWSSNESCQDDCSPYSLFHIQIVSRHDVKQPMGCANMAHMRVKGSSFHLHSNVIKKFTLANNDITLHKPVSSRVLGCEENLYFERWNSRTHPPI